MFAQVQLIERRSSLQQGHAATGDDALLNGGLGVAHGIFDAVLALLELDLGGRAGLDDRNTAGQLGQALLQLLAVVVGGGLGDLRLDLLHARLDVGLLAGTVHDGRVVLVDADLLGLAEHGGRRSPA